MQAQLAAFEAKFELRSVLGTGSTSTVRICRDRINGTEFACKIIDRDKIHTTGNQPVLEMFQNEIEVYFSLMHPFHKQLSIQI